MGRAHEVRAASMAKTAAAKSAKNGKFAKEIYMIAKAGGTSIEGNLSLKAAVERAKRNQVPADVIKNAIKKAEGGSQENYSPIRYEGYGPGGSALIVDCLTDNVNRTVSQVKNCFTKTGGNLGVSGSVSFGFDRVCMVSVKDFPQDMFEVLLEADIDVKDIEEEDDNIITVIADPADHFKIKSAIEAVKADVEYVVDEVTMLAGNKVALSEDQMVKFQKCLDMLDELEDVQEVYHNVEM